MSKNKQRTVKSIISLVTAIIVTFGAAEFFIQAISYPEVTHEDVEITGPVIDIDADESTKPLGNSQSVVISEGSEFEQNQTGTNNVYNGTGNNHVNRNGSSDGRSSSSGSSSSGNSGGWWPTDGDYEIEYEPPLVENICHSCGTRYYGTGGCPNPNCEGYHPSNSNSSTENSNQISDEYYIPIVIDDIVHNFCQNCGTRYTGLGGCPNPDCPYYNP